MLQGKLLTETTRKMRSTLKHNSTLEADYTRLHG
jgi:hypothetical protein